jgi:phosphoglycolate phosphatase-like HAD superfamily hydrolase
MKLLALDFDGVISDSAREAFAVARTAYLDLRPDSALKDMGQEPLYRSFLELMPLGNRAEDYGTVMSALDSGLSITNQDDYDSFRGAQDENWLKAYHRRFYEVRDYLSTIDPAGWRALNRPYVPLLEIIRRRAGEVSYAIATSKDKRSVEVLLKGYGVDDLFPGDLVFDKETGKRKTAHLRALHERLRAPYPEITFVDDKVNHLDSVAPLGVRCVLATWGYNGAREHVLARQRNYLVCSLDNVEEKLFGGS